MSTVAVLFHSERAEPALKLLHWLLDEGHQVCMPSAGTQESGTEESGTHESGTQGLASPESLTDSKLLKHQGAISDLATILAGSASATTASPTGSAPASATASATTASPTGKPPIDLAVSVGGDGTMLSAFDLLAAYAVPVIGINVGHLGYLTEFELHDMTAAVQQALDNQLPIEERMMIEATLEPTDPSAKIPLGPWVGLNEVILEKRDLGHTIRTEVTFDGQEFATYAADGLIVSTPTGSTAYSLSAGGAVVAPTHRSLQLTPVAPHMLFDRSIILGPEAVIRCRMLGIRTANLAVDGRSVAMLSENDTLVVKCSSIQARLVTSDQTSFQAILKQKLGLINR